MRAEAEGTEGGKHEAQGGEQEEESGDAEDHEPSYPQAHDEEQEGQKEAHDCRHAQERLIVSSGMVFVSVVYAVHF